MRKFSRSIVIGILFTLLLLAACQPIATAPAPAEDTGQQAAAEEPAAETSGEESAAAAQDDRAPVDIYLVAHGDCAWDSFWCVVEQGNDDAARALGINLTRITPSQFDPEQTAQDIDQALAANPDGLGVTVTDGVLFEEPMLRAIESGIPVIAYNTADARPRDERIPYLTYIGMDEYTAGYEAGRRLLEEGGTRAVCINQEIGHVGLDARCNGFADALAEEGIESEVLGTPNDPAEAVATLSDYHTANPDVDIYLTLGPNGANPFYSFMDAAGLTQDDIIHGTFDLGPEIAARIKDGTTKFAVDQQPYVQGYLVVQWLTWINRYGLYPPTEVTSTGPGFIDQGNIELVEDVAGTYR